MTTARRSGPAGRDAEGSRDDRRSAHRRAAPGAAARRRDRRTIICSRCWCWPSAAGTSRCRAARRSASRIASRSAETLTEGGALTPRPERMRPAARAMLVGVLSCRENMSKSGAVARIAGDSDRRVAAPANMATEESLLPVQDRRGEGRGRRRRADRGARQGHPRRRHRALQGRQLRLSGRRVPADRAGDRGREVGRRPPLGSAASGYTRATTTATMTTRTRSTRWTSSQTRTARTVSRRSATTRCRSPPNDPS